MHKCVNESVTQIASLDFSENTEGTSDQYADAANVEMEPEDASLAFVSGTLESHHIENGASTPGISAETQTEVFDYLFRKTSKHELPDVYAETQMQAFDYLYRKSSDSEAPDRDVETETEEFNYFVPKRSEYEAPDREFFKSDGRVRFYTGLPSYEVLIVMFEQVAPLVNRRTQALNKFQEFVTVLMKLRLDMLFQDLAYRFTVSIARISPIFSAWMVVMDAKLFPLVYWPEREQLWRTMPMSFQYAFGKKVTVIIDCFEVFIERPTNLLARAQTFLSYKRHNTIKILTGITPQGSICYVSETWGGCTSDKFLTENCGFLEHLLPGDMVMADRGFTITECWPKASNIGYSGIHQRKIPTRPN